ncbi:arabinosyltransferase domain-containing protein [Nocardia mangyaensis]|uniref:arabinosyltransferase domain-containing protein n=1 Tax=Nocardia mangyaensis TaxID=2213200 RepID=UPI002676C5AD|nr:arabinosyltransferase domain-containing protein [Nocardia mangyaensis]MDO3650005.1 arabinosyltransferase domain-containing protein [Nocardia mangyaensis]
MVETIVRQGHPPKDASGPARRGDRPGWARTVAIVAGVIAVLTAVAIPFLPVRVDAATISWPQQGSPAGVESPLIAYAPAEMSATVPCTALGSLAESGGVVASTIPRQSADMERYGFVVKVVADTEQRPGRVDVVSRSTLVWTAALAEVRDRSCSLAIAISPQQTTVTATGLDLPGATLDRDLRPQVVGVFSELTGAAPADLAVTIDVDSRYISSPTFLKLSAIALCLLATALALFALHRLDARDGRSPRRFLPQRWWRLRPVDWLVFAVLGLWHFIGANTSDDGYILGMARGAQSSGNMSNYYRWFSVDEGPFYTPYTDIIGWIANISAVSPLVRLPALGAGILTWWLISREVLPRLGVALRRSPVVTWTAALVFLAFWLPYNNGLRAEFVVALGVLVTWVSVERAIATRRLLPFAVAVIVAALTLTGAPSGLICVGVLVAGARTVTSVIVQRAKSVGYLAQLLPILAAGLVVLTVVFADRTLAGVREMFAVHGVIKPGESWFFEFLRYQYLLQLNADGWLTRRFGVFMMLLGIIVCVATMLRRGGHIPGTAVGPTRRMLGITLAAMVLMMFSPTKWTHQFGVFAGLATCVAAVTAVAVSSTVLRPLRNRALFAAAVSFALAMTFVGANGYWYVSSWGIPWWDKPPTVAGFGVSTVFAGLAALALAVAAWFHIHPNPSTKPGRVSGLPVLAIAAAMMVLFELASFAKASVAQYPAYSLASSNFAAAFAGGCGMADEVLVETDPNASMLAPLTGDVVTAMAGVESMGFQPDGVAPVLTSEEVESTTGQANSVSDDPDTLRDASTSAGSESRQGSLQLPFGLDPATTPVLGSYRSGPQEPAALTTGWFRLPEGPRGPLLAIAAAGRIQTVDADGVVRPGQELVVEYGTASPDGSVAVTGQAAPLDIGPAPVWRNLRVPTDQLPADADVVRLVATDRDLGPDQWLAVTPPRMPQTTTLNALVGSRSPVLLDWAVGLHFPCQNHLPTYNGVADLPDYRILPDRNGATITNLWQGHDGGGPLGWTQLLFTARTLPTYLNNDWDRDWGSIEQYLPLDSTATQAEVSLESTKRWGTWTPGPIITAW